MERKVIFFDIGNTLVAEAQWCEGAKALLIALRTAGCRIGIISNTGTFTRDELAVHLPSDFDFGDFEATLVLLSSEIGIEKPDPAIFEMAVSRTGLAQRDCLFVGENLTECWVAQSVGMLTCRVNRFPEDFISLGDLITNG